MDLDITFLIQMGLFLTVLMTLNGLFFQPILKVFAARQKKLEGAKHDVEKLLRDAAADLENYMAKLREARDQAQKDRDALVAQGRDEERKLLTQVRAEISKSLNAARAELAEAENAAKKNLNEETEQMAKKLVAKVLGREVAA